MVPIPGTDPRGRHRYNVGRVHITPRRLLKWFALALGGLAALVLLAILVIVWFVDPNSFKPRIESAVRDATGRELRLTGDIELGFFPWLALRGGAGELANPPGFGPEPMVSWGEVSVGARLLPLLRGELVTDRILVRGANVRLVRRADGVANWDGLGGGSDPAAAADSEPMKLRVAGVRIEDSRLSFVDETAPSRIEIQSFSLATDGYVPGEPITGTNIAGVLHMTGFAPEGLPFRVKVPKLVAPADFSTVQAPAFELAVGGLELEAGLDAALGEAPRASGELRSNTFDPRALLATVGIELPKTTDPQALGKLRFAANFRYGASGEAEAAAIAIEPLSLVLDDTSFEGLFRLGGRENAIGEFALRGDRIDVERYIPPSDPDSEPFALPTELLKSLRHRGVVELEHAKYGDVEMDGVVLRLVLDEQGLRTEAPESERKP